jgi:phage terminase large subunit
MRFKVLKKYAPILNSDKRYIFIMGGRGAGRSYFASQMVAGALETFGFFRCAIMRFILGDIRNSIYQEVVDRIEEQGKEKEFEFKNLEITNKETGNFIKGIGFRKSSSDQKSKLKSLASFNYVIIEESDEVAEEDFMQLDDSLRTLKGDIRIIFLLNLPPKGHWILKRWFNLIPSEIKGYYNAVLKDSEKYNTLHVHTTYLGNAHNLNQSTKDNYERYKITRPDYYYNVIRGLVSEGVRGRIFSNWKVITDKEFEELPYEEFYGMDFGFTNDPTALVAIKMHNDRVYARELLYETGLINKRIAGKFSDLKMNRVAPNYADSAEPKSISELRLLDWNVMPASKGADSVKAGIDFLLGKEVYYTESSKNISTEVQNYCWALDRNKEPTNKAKEGNDHIMDAIRYGVWTHSKRSHLGVV